METINNISGSYHYHRNTIYKALSDISIPTTAATGMDAIQVCQ